MVVRPSGPRSAEAPPVAILYRPLRPDTVLTLFVDCSLALLVIWLGYPAVIALIAYARAGERRVGGVADRVRVTVIIASADSETVIRERASDALAGDYPAELLNVVVGVDHTSRVDCVRIAESDPRVRVVAGDPPGGKASALNAAVRAATGDILIFTDSAQRFERSAITRLVAALSDESFGAVSGALQIGRDGAPANLAERYWIFERWLRLQEARVHSAVGVTGAIYALRRTCWHPLPVGLILDDVYVPMHLVLRGFRTGFEPSACAYDDRRFPPAQEFRRKARTLTGVLQLCAWLPELLVPWRNPIWLQFIFHKLLRLATPYLIIGAAVGLLAWTAQSLVLISPTLALAVVLGSLVTGVLLIAVSRPLRAALQMALALQAATMRATVNGLRGDWDVWSR